MAVHHENGRVGLVPFTFLEEDLPRPTDTSMHVAPEGFGVATGSARLGGAHRPPEATATADMAAVTAVIGSRSLVVAARPGHDLSPGAASEATPGGDSHSASTGGHTHALVVAAAHALATPAADQELGDAPLSSAAPGRVRLPTRAAVDAALASSHKPAPVGKGWFLVFALLICEF